MIRSRLQIGVTFTGFRFRIAFDTSSTPSRATAWLAVHHQYLIEPCLSVTDIPARFSLSVIVPGSAPGPMMSEGHDPGHRAFYISSPQLWNLLPAGIRLHPERPACQDRRLKTHYMQQSMLCHWGSMSTVWTVLLLLATTWHRPNSHHHISTGWHPIISIFMLHHMPKPA